jgi:hypothetical protein
VAAASFWNRVTSLLGWGMPAGAATAMMRTRDALAF